MGKVGSTTVKSSLENVKLPNPVYHVHFLSWAGIREIEKYYLNLPKAEVPDHIQRSKKLRYQIDNNFNGDRWKVITLVREPISRDISNLFQNMEDVLPGLEKCTPNEQYISTKNYLLSHFSHFEESNDYVCNWLDKELNSVFKIDIFNTKFPKTLGYQIFSTPQADILLIKLEKLSSCYKEAFERFLKLNHISLINKNIGSEKPYKAVYEQITRSIKIPENYVNKIYQTRFVKHFYNDAEILDFKKKWSKSGSIHQRSNPITKSYNKKILIIHPEGNINNNPNLKGMVEILTEQNYRIDICSPKRNLVNQNFKYYDSKLILIDTEKFSPINGYVLLNHVKNSDETQIKRYISENIGEYDFIFGIDRGIIEASVLAESLNIPYGLISYEIFFDKETGTAFKDPEIRACKNICFAVCQDNTRAKKLSRENRIPIESIINIPVAGRGKKEGKRNNYLYNHLGIDRSKKIALYIGTIEKWSGIDDLILATYRWPDDWVLVLHNRYGMDKSADTYYQKFNSLGKIFFSLNPVPDLNCMQHMLHSADLGIAIYKPQNNSIWEGDNLKYIGMASGKIATYLQHGIPVLINEIGEMSDYVRQYRLGKVVEEIKSAHLNISGTQLNTWKSNCLDFFENKLDLNKTIYPLLEQLNLNFANRDNQINYREFPHKTNKKSQTKQYGIFENRSVLNETSSSFRNKQIENKVFANRRKIVTPIGHAPNSSRNNRGYAPQICIVTPSFNQGEFLEECIDSILSQNYPHLDYVIMDGGSTDGSIETIRKYAKYLSYWQSKPDGGQYAAVNSGFQKSNAEVMGWLNSDDKLHPDALFKIGYIFSTFTEVEWISGLATKWDKEGRLIELEERLKLWSHSDYLNRQYKWIQQESTFWKKSLWQKAGGYLDSSFKLAGDLELWARFFRIAQLYRVCDLLGGYRFHGNQKAQLFRDEYIHEAEAIIDREISLLKKEKGIRLLPPPEPIIINKHKFDDFISAINPVRKKRYPSAQLYN
jgi:hypothetical protein